jgi:hypothetical protein
MEDFGIGVKLTTIALVLSLSECLAGCRESAKTDDQLMNEFVQSVMESAKLRNLDRLVTLSFYKQATLSG